MWKRVRVYNNIPAGKHKLGVQCRTSSGAAFGRAVAGTAFEDELGSLKPIQVIGLVQQLPFAKADLVRKVFRDLLHLDFKMKTSSVNPELGLEIAAARPVAREV